MTRLASGEHWNYLAVNQSGKPSKPYFEFDGISASFYSHCLEIQSSLAWEAHETDMDLGTLPFPTVLEITKGRGKYMFMNWWVSQTHTGSVCFAVWVKDLDNRCLGYMAGIAANKDFLGARDVEDFYDKVNTHKIEEVLGGKPALYEALKPVKI